MSKYIRTKEFGIRYSDHYECDGNGWYYNVHTNIYAFPKSDLLGEADTVDELCDCYLEDTGKGVPCIVSKGMWAQCHKDKAFRGESDFYACVVKRNYYGVPTIQPTAKLNKEMGWDLL